MKPHRIVISTILVSMDEEEKDGGAWEAKGEELEAMESMVRLSVSDNGPGIAKEDIDAIFDPFFSQNPDGFGLGLSITHTIVEEHGGRIVVESEPGKGATFHLYLPVKSDFETAA